MDKLRCCPHCGGAAYLEQSYSCKLGSYFIFAKCSICGAQGKIYNSADEPWAAAGDTSACKAAAAAWNMRTTDKQEAGTNGKG